MSNDNTLHSTTELPFFFILGRTRSGTTLLRNLFDAHPHVAIPTEIPFIPTTYRKFGRIKIWEDSHIRDYIHCISKFDKFKNLRIEKEQLEKILISARNQKADFNYTDVVKTLAYHYPSAFEKHDVTLLGDKSPAYSMFPQTLYRIFPDAKYVVIVRDYRDVVASVKQIDFELPFTAKICINWRISQKRILRFYQEHPQQVMLLKYEDFVASPETQLKEICAFLQVKFFPEVMDTFNQPKAMAQEFNTTFFNKHHASLKKPINTDRIELWRQRLKPIEVRIADFFVGKYAELSGYRREHTSFDLGAILYSLPVLVLGFCFVLLMSCIHLLPAAIRGKFWAPAEIVARVYYRTKKRKAHE